MLVGCAQIEDKFGDNWITGAFIVRKDNPTEWTIDTFLLSCRVMDRGVEDAILRFILNEVHEVYNHLSIVLKFLTASASPSSSKYWIST